MDALMRVGLNFDVIAVSVLLQLLCGYEDSFDRISKAAAYSERALAMSP